MSDDKNTMHTDDAEIVLKEQLAVMRKKLFLSRVTAVMAVIMAVAFVAAVVLVVPRAVQTLDRADRLLKELDGANLADTVRNVNELAEGSQKEIAQTLDKLNQLDLTSLNQAIQNLEEATRPLAGLFGR